MNRETIIGKMSQSEEVIKSYFKHFNPPNGISEREAFVNQFRIIHDAFPENTVIIGDFKL